MGSPQIILNARGAKHLPYYILHEDHISSLLEGPRTDSSILTHGLRLICIKSYNGHNFVKIYQNLPKFGNLGKIGNLNFPVT